MKQKSWGVKFVFAFLKLMIVHTSVVALLVTSSPIALAQSSLTGSSAGVSSAQSLPFDDSREWGAAMQGMNQFTGFMQQQAAQQAAMAQQAALAGQLQPQIIPARFFPGCRITPARDNFPENVCTNIESPGMMQNAEFVATIATQRITLYENMTSMAQNSAFSSGLRCLDDAKKGVDSQLQTKINNLQALINQLKKNTQLFRDANQKLLNDMKDNHSLLNGGGNQMADQGRVFRDMFNDPACREVLSDKMLTDSQSGGLRGVKQVFNTGGSDGQSLRTQAANIVRDEAVYRKHLDLQVDRMVKDIQEMGIDDWAGGGAGRLDRVRRGGLTNFAGMTEAFTQEMEDFNREKQKIQQELSAIGFQLPAMDEHFKSNIGNFANGAKIFFRKKFVNECVNGSGSTGVALNPDQILRGLRQTNNRDGGTTLEDFKIALRNILSNDSFIEDKMAQIKSLQGKFGGAIQVEFINENAQKTRLSPYDLYRETISRCEVLYEQDDTFAPSNNTGSEKISRKAAVERAQRYLEDAKKLESNFINSLVSSIKDRILNCGHNEGATTSGKCGSETMSPTGNDFCLNTARQCAANIGSCYNKVETIINQKEAEQKVLAGRYNTNMQALVARQEGILKGIQAQVNQDGEFLRRFFPGADFEFPEDLFVGMPKMEDSEFGIRLVGGGKLDFLEQDLPQKLGQLKDQLSAQKERVKGVIDGYIGEQKTAMEKNKSDWEKVKSECTQNANQFRTQVAQANKAGAEQQAKKDQEVGEFCSKYDSLRRLNPGAGCGVAESLHGEVARIANHVDSTVRANLDEYRNVCAQVNNESTAGTENSGSGEGSAMNQMCGSGGSMSTAVNNMLGRMMRNVPPQHRSKQGDIRRFIANGSPSLSSLGIGGSFGQALQNLREVKTATVNVRERQRTVEATPTPTPSTTTTNSGNNSGGSQTLAQRLEEVKTTSANAKTLADRSRLTRSPLTTNGNAKARLGGASGVVNFGDIRTDDNDGAGEMSRAQYDSIRTCFEKPGLEGVFPAWSDSCETGTGTNSCTAAVKTNLLQRIQGVRDGLNSANANNPSELKTAADTQRKAVSRLMYGDDTAEQSLTGRPGGLAAARECLKGKENESSFNNPAGASAGWHGLRSALNMVNNALGVKADGSSISNATDAGPYADPQPTRFEGLRQTEAKLGQLVTAADQARSLASNTPSSSSRDSGETITDPCAALRELNNQYIDNRCQGTTGNTRTRCRDRAEDRAKTRVPSQLSSINGRMENILNLAASGSSQNTEALWARIGQRTNGGCAAFGTGARNQGGLFETFLRTFDQNTQGSGTRIR